MCRIMVAIRRPLLCFLSLLSLIVLARMLYDTRQSFTWYQEVQLSDAGPTSQPRYYFNIPQNMSFTEKKKKLMFLKTHKCGTSSLVTILYLYGIRRNLNFLLTPYEHQFYNDRPAQVLAPGQQHDILCQHHRTTGSWDYYRPWVIHPLLPKEKTFYFTILRNPKEQFLSNFLFYKHDEKMVKKYDIRAKSVDGVVRKYLLQLPKQTLTCNNVINPMSFDLGFSHFLQKKRGYSPDVQILSFIHYLDKEFDLVMITDEFDKSLVLLAQYLEWNIRDVVYLKKMTRNATRKTDEHRLSEDTLQLLRKHNRVDFKIFEYFQQKFQAGLNNFDQKKIQSDLETLQEGKDDLFSTCLNTSTTVNSPLGTVYHPLSQTGRLNPNCRLWTMSDIHISKTLSAKQDPMFSKKQSKLLNLKNITYNIIVNIMNLFGSIRSEYLHGLGIGS